MENKKYYGWKGFFPLLTFLAIYLGSGLICAALGYGGDSFKQVPRMAALVGALLVCMCMGGKERSLEYRMDTFCKGMSNQGTMIMIMVFLLAGAFSAGLCAGYAVFFSEEDDEPKIYMDHTHGGED